MSKRQTKPCCPEEPIAEFEKELPGNRKWEEVLARYAKAISHPVRLRILDILKSRNTCICGEIVDELPIAQATVSQHLKVLKNAGLIRGAINGPSTCYCINKAAVRQFKKLLKDL
ncbi:MAG: winged helix-turn-helix transcriptional regulator [Deltaproteobacteria bacterium]|nr:winged helix-turn-helix transcriptional regulator [Deltaproteobacteria bacterium]